MKSTGIVRKVDELGRIVLPIEMRRTLDIAEKDPVEIYVEGDSVILRKYQASCVFCDSVKEISETAFYRCFNLKLVVGEGSTAERICIERGLPYILA